MGRLTADDVCPALSAPSCITNTRALPAVILIQGKFLRIGGHLILIFSSCKPPYVKGRDSTTNYYTHIINTHTHTEHAIFVSTSSRGIVYLLDG